MWDYLLYGGKVITENEVLPRGYVAICEGRIVSLGENWNEVKAKNCLDVSGFIVSPGFIDMHTHGIFDVDFVEGDVERIASGLSHYLSFGVTKVVASTISRPLPETVEQIQRLRQVKESNYGRILHGVHLEGPWLSPRCRGGHPLQYLRVPSKEDVAFVLGEVGDVLVTVTFAPELPNAVWLAETLTYRGIIPVIGHTEASYEEAERVIRAGARHVTHMYDGTLGYRENPQEALVMLPGVETAVLFYDTVSVELIGCPVHVPPPFFKFIHKVKPKGKKVLVTDSLVGTGMPEGTVLTYRDGRKVRVAENVIRMIDEDPAIDGNLTGSGVTMNVALRRLKEYTGIPLEEAIAWGAINPASVLGIDKEVGSIAVGKQADLVVIDENFEAQYTFLAGDLVFRKS
ncbi:MAG: N-acetylglucosamine-6-phosphate deacetylase [Atribacterota bacterium]